MRFTTICALFVATLTLCAAAEDPLIGASFPFSPPPLKPSQVYLERPARLAPTQPAQAPVLDGVLSDDCWATAPALALTHPTRPTGEPAVALIAFGAEAIYVAGIAPLPQDKFEGKTAEQSEQLLRTLSAARQHDLNVWMDESFEIFIDPGRSTQRYFQFIVNTLNTQQESEGFTSAWNGQWQSAVFIAPATAEGTPLPAAVKNRTDIGAVVGRTRLYWTCEAAIPYATLQTQAPKAGERWGINVVRNDKLGGADGIWSHTLHNNHEPVNFGEFCFVDQMPETTLAAFWTAKPPAPGENELTLLQGGKPQPVSLILTAGGEKTALPPIEPTNKGLVALKLSFPTPGRYEITPAAPGPGTTRIVYEIQPPPQALSVKLDQPELYPSERALFARVVLPAASEKEPAPATLRVRAEDGKLLREGAAAMASKGVEFEVQTAGLKVGRYLLEVQAGGQTVTQPFRVICGPFDAAEKSQ